ncbi:hypothetical protein ACJRO7_006065 [Eucalyptus globulus]|uniref:DUF7610 domain-containing protein n=1 Tax=Eucalyptus globulus TaxID=34317 RepID=A0ABD3IH90_EUCGL
MTNRYFMLQRKLEDTESELKSAFSLAASETPSRQFLSECIRQRLLFLNNLLSAEFASDPKRPQHLSHVARRLADLEAAFHAWDNDEDEAGPTEDASVCSCTESCLRDDDGNDDGGEDAKEELAVDEWNDLPVTEEDNGLAKGLESEERAKEGGEKVGEGGKLWRVVNLVGGMAVVGAAVMAMFSGFVLHHLDHGDAFVVPPT